MSLSAVRHPCASTVLQKGCKVAGSFFAVAHFDVQENRKGKPDHRFHLQPNAHDMQAERLKKSPPAYNRFEIAKWGNSFEKLGADLISFAESLPKSFMDPRLQRSSTTK